MVFIILNILAFIGSIVASCSILYNKQIRFPFKVLAIWMLISLIFLPIPILIEFNQFVNFPNFYRIPAPFMYLMGPIIYIFTRASLNDEKRFYKRDWLHALPFLFHILELLPFYFSPFIIKQEEIRQIDWNSLSYILNSNEGIFTAKIHTFLKLISSLIYIILSVRIIYKYVSISDCVPNKMVQFVLLIVFSRILQILMVAMVLILPYHILANLIINLPNTIVLIVTVILLLIHTINVQEIYKEEFSNQFVSLTKLELFDGKMKLKAMDSASSDLILYLSPTLEVIHFNKAYKDYIYLVYGKKIHTGYNYKKILETPNFEWFLTEFNKIIIDHKQRLIENEYVTSMSGNLEWFSIEMNPVFDDHSKLIGIIIFNKNISYKKDIEFKNLEKIKNLESIAWNHSHLMRAPLSNILGLTSQMVKSTKCFSCDSNMAELIKYVESEALKLDKIIRENVQRASF